MILEKFLQEIGVTSAFSIELFKDKSVIREYSKSENVFVEGGKNETEYIVLSGVLHRFNISEKGEIITTGFYMSKSAITPHFARTNNGKCIFTLQTLTDVVIAEIPVIELDNLRYNNKEFNEFGQKIMQMELRQTFYNDIVYRSFSAKERLLILRKHFQNLENIIPHDIIASYLGITNVSLSRLRNKLTNK